MKLCYASPSRAGVRGWIEGYLQMTRTSRQRFLFEGQGAHALLLVLLAAVTIWFAYSLGQVFEGSWLGLPTVVWFYCALGVAVAHQVWVVVWWRLEFHTGACSRALGPRAFRIFAAGFAVLALGRIATVVGASVANADTLPIPLAIRWTVAGVMVLPLIWLMVSMRLYFGFDHALGADHFFEEHRHRGLCRRGIFRYVPNSMYTVGFLVLWAPAIAAASRTGMILAAFNQIYIWVHYFCTEKPDMRRIYS